MNARMTMAVAGAVAAGGIVLALVITSDESPGPPPPSPPTAAHPRAVRADCSTRSEADFPGAFTSPRNLVVGPLVLVGGAYTDPETVREFGGNKFPLLVEAGHVVTVELAREARRTAGLAYGPLPQGRTRLRDAHRSVTFVACPPGDAPKRYKPRGPSRNHADGTSVTFWSGAVLTRAPGCIPLDVYVDDAPSPRRVGLALGRRCSY